MVYNFKESDNFEKIVEDSVCILDFNATWCGPCRMLHPVFDKVSEEIENVKFISVDVDDNPTLSAKFGIRSIPTLIILKNGKIINSSMGYLDEDALTNFIKKSI
ncbi:MAG: thioredoxin [Bacillales bacterium]